MSISTFQDKFVKGGCGRFVLIFCGAALVLGMAFSNCSRGQKLMAVDAKGNKQKAFATVGDVELPISMADKAIDAQIKQAGIPPEVLDGFPQYKVQMVAGGVTQTIQTAQVYEIARRQGYRADDETIRKTLHFTSESDFMDNLLATIKKAGQIKPDATLKDLEEMAKAELKDKTLKDFYNEKLKEFDVALKDPAKRLELALGVSQQYLIDKFSVGINPTDDEVKKGFENYEIKRILIKSATATTDPAAKARADKAYADLKAGKSFEEVMDASSEEIPADPKKKKSEDVINLSQNQVEQLPDFKAVLKLQPGTFSEPEKVTEGYAILKYVGKKVDIPKDYEAKKATYKQQEVSKQVGKKFKAEMDKVEKEVKPSFDVKAYEAAYRFQKASTVPAGPAQEQEFKAVYDLAKTVTSADDKPDVAAIVQLFAIQHLYDQPGADKNKLKADRIASLENYLTYGNSWAYRKEVIDAYKEKADKTKAFDQVMIALEKNDKFDAQAQSTYSDIAAKFTEIKTAGLVNADQEKQFRSRQEQWTSDKKKFDDQVAADKKQRDEDAKKAAADAKKNAPPSTPPKKPAGK